MTYRILAINPGSTSTKIAVYDGEEQILVKTIDHPAEEIAKYNTIQDQFEMRKEAVLNILKENSIDLKSLSAIVGRGGVLPPVKSGAYLVNEEMIDVLRHRPVLEHASNLGAVVAHAISEPLGINSYIYDSVAVDELIGVARISGLCGMDRSSAGHALNTRAMALKYAKDKGKDYKSLNLIVAHIGGGVSIYLHEKGRMVDMLSDDEGPFSPERSGRVPATKLVAACYSGQYSEREMTKKIRGKGGIVSYLNTVDAREVEKMIAEGNEEAKIIYEAMAYQLAKGIGELATVVDGKVDAIIITGGIAYSEMFTSMVKKKVEFIAPVEIMAGENELESLAFGTLRVLNGEEEARIYSEN
ncbi:butyrate kinase [Clostridioides difficile]|uniref:butyrate kinase n=1 Tax=Clostridioides difficile TaxID=1496 RepID=UPI001FAE58A5|nr:butyrate kinase [Clostridioides difficile]MCJ0223239.1 butyrate kinase [Clostridioides difficile]MCJ0430554.1 butyrate kinase [Clostridioides difficile]MCJ0435763.1 butyrate kinase [Clostridioides difficile]MCU6147595.1 butyrate kinase [Clostridioides difficile]